MEGFEPSFSTPITDNRLEVYLGYTCVVREAGVEPTSSDSKSDILPLDDSRLNVIGGTPYRTQTCNKTFVEFYDIQFHQRSTTNYTCCNRCLRCRTCEITLVILLIYLKLVPVSRLELEPQPL